MDKDPERKPAYVRIKMDLIARIKGGEWPPKGQLPPEPKLQQMYGGVSRGTVRQALQELENAGYILRRQGKGTFVASAFPTRLQYQIGEIISFSEQVRRAGAELSTRVLDKEIAAVGGIDIGVQRLLELTAGSRAIRICRLRLMNGAPVAIQTVFLPSSRCPGIFDDDLTSLFRVYAERYHVRITQAKETLASRLARPDEVRLLEIPADAHVFERRRLSYDQEGSPFEFLVSTDAEGRFEYHYRIFEDNSQLR